jgi:tetratricopeptide (TPR) repeat protein
VLQERATDAPARRLLADVLSWDGQYEESLEIMARLLKENPEDESLELRQAEVTFWAGRHDAATALLRRVLERKFDKPDVWPTYISAAAVAQTLTDRDALMIRQVAERFERADTTDVALLARLAWVLARTGARDSARIFIDRALALKPVAPDLRREFAGILGAVGRHMDGIRLYEGLALSADDRCQLALLYAGAGETEKAVALCNVVLTEKGNEPKSRRLLADVLCAAGRFRDALAVVDELIRESPRDVELLVRQAEMVLASGEREKALGMFQRLLDSDSGRASAWYGYVAAAATVERLTAAQMKLIERVEERMGEVKDVAFLSRLAWVYFREGNQARAQALLEQAVALKPAEPVVKRELAGVLAAVGRNEEALALYDGLPLSLDDRYRLAGIYSAIKNFSLAAEQCRAILADKPGDKTARRLLADVLSWDEKHAESLELFATLLQESPSLELRVRQAEVTLWSKDYDAALAMFQALLDSQFDQSRLWTSFVDAAASAKVLSAPNAATAHRIVSSLRNTKIERATFFSRLAWILLRLKHKEKASALLDQALAMNATDPATRKEIAGVLSAVGRNQQALELYKGLDLEPSDRLRLAELYAADRKLDEAERELRATLEALPNDRKAKLLLADVLLWNRKTDEARLLYEGISHAEPDHPELPERFAQLALASGDYDVALDRFQKLLATEFERPNLWKGFVDAAASAAKLDAPQVQTALRIYEAQRKNPWKDAVYLTRLAWVLRRSGEFNKATELLRDALDLEPESRIVRIQLAETLYECGLHEEAEKHFKQLLRTGAPPVRQPTNTVPGD